MTQPGIQPSPARADERQIRILNAAERCFARAGFHRTTMADIAGEAGMSAGNLYRYFDSKDEVVAQLCARDRAEIAQGFIAMVAAPDPFAAFEALLRHYLVEEPRERSMLIPEIWAEAARNPRIAEIGRAFDTDIREKMTAFLRDLVGRGLASDSVDHTGLIEFVMVSVDGVIANRARCPDFNPAPFVARISTMTRLGAQGDLRWLMHPIKQDGRPLA